ncbi:2425_t:CDS:2 [Funneliformis geosporum]|uniref:histidine--tRNA ligase n=1 Tax=Funneliformis geosporum TaxID=1117311 RepID=A0A9W4SW16_9GLOM|nr:10269_t:CDS:2 [Funneliformis geosporum]CAI2188136.1 2425_t:CDS:2 [Funneliformis geosporum]
MSPLISYSPRLVYLSHSNLWQRLQNNFILHSGRSLSTEPARPVRGTRDRFGTENAKYDHILKVASSIAELHCYNHVSTPILELSQVFERTLGDDSDIVGKELYSFIDNGDNKLTLRPEGTAGKCVMIDDKVPYEFSESRIVRALISNNLLYDLPQKFYYYGPMFRHERPQKGRLRQFEQFGVELFGHEHPTSDIEVINMAWTFLNKIGLGGFFEIEINSLADNESRTRYREAVRDYLRKYEHHLSEDSVKRISTNPLRVLDSKNPKDVPIIQNCPKITEYYNSTSAKRFDVVCQGLQSLGIPYKINPHLVRGLDYYDSTIFEFKCMDSNLGVTQGTILAGGRYDGLVQMMGGKDKIPGIGWAAGIDRLAMILDENILSTRERPIAIVVIPNRENAPSSENGSTDLDSIIPLKNNKLYYHGLNLSKSLRDQDISTLFYHPPSSSRQSSLKITLSNVAKSNASHVILVGENEMSKGEVTIKDLDNKIQEECNFEDILQYIMKKKLSLN